MSRDNLIKDISDKNVDIEKFVKSIIIDDILREEVINLMLTNKDIMVYYHCYYIVSKASEIKPELFYEHWDDFSSLLNHQNSYHRNIGLTIIANLVRVDNKNLFEEIFDDYFSHLHDEKFMTTQCCLKETLKIVKVKNNLQDKIVSLLLDIDAICNYPEKQKELLKHDILAILDLLYEYNIDKKSIGDFIKMAGESISPKTRKKVVKIMDKYKIQ